MFDVLISNIYYYKGHWYVFDSPIINFNFPKKKKYIPKKLVSCLISPRFSMDTKKKKKERWIEKLRENCASRTPPTNNGPNVLLIPIIKKRI